jgi:hypothetical protein
VYLVVCDERLTRGALCASKVLYCRGNVDMTVYEAANWQEMLDYQVGRRQRLLTQLLTTLIGLTGSFAWCVQGSARHLVPTLLAVLARTQELTRGITNQPLHQFVRALTSQSANDEHGAHV